jgi:hypothetical protein
MAERGILMSAPMVRATLAGTKTQTRRTLKPQPNAILNAAYVDGEGWIVAARGDVHSASVAFVPPPYRAGDRLYVREAWRTFVSLDAVKPRDLLVKPDGEKRGAGIYYEAGERLIGPTVDVATYLTGDRLHGLGRRRPGRHLPRWASRIWLTVTDVRVQRLQEISPEDCVAEGLNETNGTGPADSLRYSLLWESINGPGSWDANPWVAAYTFTVEKT